MKQRDVCKYLFDISESCKRLQEFTAGQELKDYLDSFLLKSAVERQFEIIGEAMGQMLRTAPELEKRISNCRRMIAFRNVLIHGYASIDDELVWGIVETQLSRLVQEVNSLLKELG